ncbi:hypothetical protein PPYR_05586 [Photinus pyralis]|uniref:Major facilitator superfamily (MFS) profile domain-containing protein n=1 Tax=Photinus pyralis TaxID=7054 RepID=A0A1Y1MWX5_PHOPY|nr:facilitated trehalose transporter Tret1-2 homolog [Photinus pyralis]KAB0801232.1 hypothetical protein PPYR_05586 [Photinus pyralis]
MDSDGANRSKFWDNVVQKFTAPPSVYTVNPQGNQKKDTEVEDPNTVIAGTVSENRTHENNVRSRATHASYGISFKKPRLFNQVLASISIACVSAVTGFISAFTAPATDGIKMELKVSDEEFSWVGSLVPLGALVGALVGGQLINFFGRKRTILIANVLFLICWGSIAIASSVEFLFVARGISGFAVGIASLTMPLYIGETIEPHVRGTLGLLPTAFGNIGILLCFLLGTYLSWRTLAWCGALLSIPFLFLVFLIPETPRWYASRNRDREAHDALRWLRGPNEDIHEEYSNLFNKEKGVTPSVCRVIMELREHAHLKALIIALGLMFFQQFTGITAVIYYATDVFNMSGSEIDSSLSTIIVGLVNFASTFIASVLVDKAGRKVLLYVSSLSMILTLITLGTYFYFLHLKFPITQYGWVPLFSLIVYVLGFSLGFGPIPWLMLGEIFPIRVKGIAASFATAFHWLCTFVVTKSFVNIIQGVGPYGAFWIFGILSIASVVFVSLIVPETKNKSLDEIEAIMNTRKGTPYVFKP